MNDLTEDELNTPFGFVEYKLSNGQILGRGQALARNMPQTLAGGVKGFLIVPNASLVDVDRAYVKGGQLVARPALPIPENRRVKADGQETIRFAVPPGTIAEIDGEEHVIEDGIFEFSATVPDTYKVKIRECFPFLPKSFSIEATT